MIFPERIWEPKPPRAGVIASSLLQRRIIIAPKNKNVKFSQSRSNQQSYMGINSILNILPPTKFLTRAQRTPDRLKIILGVHKQHQQSTARSHHQSPITHHQSSLSFNLIQQHHQQHQHQQQQNKSRKSHNHKLQSVCQFCNYENAAVSSLALRPIVS